jgi:hypothetical protein
VGPRAGLDDLEKRYNNNNNNNNTEEEEEMMNFYGGKRRPRITLYEVAQTTMRPKHLPVSEWMRGHRKMASLSSRINKLLSY